MRFERIAVLGSNSFAGAAFVAEALEHQTELVGFNRSTEGGDLFLPYRASGRRDHYRFIQADLNNDFERIADELARFRPQVVVDFAGQGMVAESWQNPAQWYQTNILSKIRLHEYLRQAEWLERYVRISTPEVYGSQETRIKETWAYNPSTPYAVSHAAIDMSLRAYNVQYGFPVIFNRFANFYGPGQQLYRIVPRTIIYGLTGKKLQLHGGGTSVRAFIHGSDVARGILASLERGVPGEIYHFSSERFLTIRQVVELICQRMGIAFDALTEVSADRPGKDLAYLMDSSRARSELGWRDEVTFEAGIDQTIAWVRQHLTTIRELPLNYIHKP
ncbi:GDP-mannose 4,6-dehydratase [Viridibacterium curvum]|uniref:dTDP-glucose 4,6-dehydratase n=1 Tax=Viridibacterium curvum TaxID=1101404 RepID=A0ABP9QLN4_9RHOO